MVNFGPATNGFAMIALADVGGEDRVEDVPKNDFMRRCCLIHLKNSSTCHR